MQQLAAHKRILFKLAYSYCPKPEERPDLIQDMVLELWSAYPRFDAALAQFSTWMYRVAMNVAISAHRRSRPAHEQVPLEDFGLDIAEAERLYDSQSDRMRTLDRLIAQLDEMNRALILLFLDGHDHAAIASILGLNAGTVATRLTRIKQRLQTQFAAESAAS